MDNEKARSVGAIEKAYTNRDNRALLEAFVALQQELVRDVQSLGRVTAMLRLGDSSILAEILNKTAAETGQTTEGKLAFAAGFLSGFCNDLLVNKDREDVLVANARLSSDPKAGKQDHAIRMAILKMAFAHEGVRFTELISTVARIADAGHNTVKYHVKKLMHLKLLDRVQLGKKAVLYRTSPLGESVLVWGSNPHELAEFLVDFAAQNQGMREAMQAEIDRTWPARNREASRLVQSLPEARSINLAPTSQETLLISTAENLGRLMNSESLSPYKV